MPTYDYLITNSTREDGLARFARVYLIVDGETVDYQDFSQFLEDGDQVSASEQAASYAMAWYEACTTSLEERLGPNGIEYQREMEERHG